MTALRPGLSPELPGKGPLALLGLLSWWERIPGCQRLSVATRELEPSQRSWEQSWGGEGNGALEAGLSAPSQQAQS